MRLVVPSLFFIAAGLPAAEIAQSPPAPAVPAPIGQHGEPLIVTAERRATDPWRATTAIDVADTEDWHDRGYVEANTDRLRFLPGVAVANTGGGVATGSAVGVRIRGNPASMTQFQLDGIPLNDATSIAGDLDAGKLQPAGVARAEIVRGSQSGLYGSRAVGGVVNLLTARPTAETRTQVQAGGGTFGTVLGSAAISGPVGSSDGFAVAVEGLHTDGWSDQVDGADGNPRDPEADHANRLASSGRWEHDFGGGLSWYAAGYQARVLRDLDQGDPEDEEGDVESNVWRGATGLGWRHGPLIDAAIDAAYTGTHRAFEFFGEERYTSREAILQARETARIAEPVALTIGSDLRSTTGSVLSNGIKQLEEDDRLLGIWGQAQWSDRLLEASLTGRHDQHSGAGGFQTGRAAAGVFPVPEWKVRGAIANGYRLPSLYEQGVDVTYPGFPPSFPDSRYVGTANLDPERSLSFEAGSDWAVVDGLTLQGTVFRTLYRDRITVSAPVSEGGVDVYRYVNVDSGSRTDGFELGADADRPEELPLGARIAYTFLRSDDGTGEEMVGVSRHAGSAALTAHQDDLGGFALWQTATVQRSTGYRTASSDADGLTWFGIAAGVEWDRTWELALRIDNLFDEQAPIPDFGSYTSTMPRTFVATATGRF